MGKALPLILGGVALAAVAGVFLLGRRREPERPFRRRPRYADPDPAAPLVAPLDVIEEEAEDEAAAVVGIAGEILGTLGADTRVAGRAQGTITSPKGRVSILMSEPGLPLADSLCLTEEGAMPCDEIDAYYDEAEAEAEAAITAAIPMYDPVECRMLGEVQPKQFCLLRSHWEADPMECRRFPGVGYLPPFDICRRRSER